MRVRLRRVLAIAALHKRVLLSAVPTSFLYYQKAADAEAIGTDGGARSHEIQTLFDGSC